MHIKICLWGRFCTKLQKITKKNELLQWTTIWIPTLGWDYADVNAKLTLKEKYGTAHLSYISFPENVNFKLLYFFQFAV